MNPITRFCLVSLAGITLLIAGALMDGPDDMHAEWDQSQAIKDLQASEAGSARRQQAAQKLCWQERGPQSEARWTVEGHLVCTVRNGVRSAAL